MKTLPKGTYYGAMYAERHINGILFSEYDYLSDKTDWHFHENPYFMYVLQGNLYDTNKKEKTVCPPGSLLLHNWQEPHFNAKQSSHARGFHIEFEKSWFDQQKIDIQLWQGSQLIQNPSLHHIIAKLYAEFRCADVYTGISCELLLAELCERIEHEKTYSSGQHPAWLAKLIEIVHDSNEPFSLRTLSQQLGIHPGHLSRAIPHYFSTTLGDYIRRVKIKKALDMMVSTKKPLFDVAYDCGFADQSHFSRTFKRYMGLTPRAFQRKCR